MVSSRQMGVIFTGFESSATAAASQSTLIQNVCIYQKYTVNNYMQVTGMVTGENFAFFIYRHFVEIL